MSKPVLNYSENKVQSAIVSLCSQYHVDIHSKMRVADVFEIAQLDVRRRLWRYYLSAHFDLVFCYGNHTIMALEFDGPTHQQDFNTMTRDESKNTLARIAKFPIFRVRSLDVEPTPEPLLARLKLRLERFKELKDALAQSGCPLCSAALVERHSHRGTFWGCSLYRETGCKGSRNVKDFVPYLCLL